jgi:hypothetical protein
MERRSRLSPGLLFHQTFIGTRSLVMGIDCNIASASYFNSPTSAEARKATREMHSSSLIDMISAASTRCGSSCMLFRRKTQSTRSNACRGRLSARRECRMTRSPRQSCKQGELYAIAEQSITRFVNLAWQKMGFKGLALPYAGNLATIVTAPASMTSATL